jgi:hypothetical protein
VSAVDGNRGHQPQRIDKTGRRNTLRVLPPRANPEGDFHATILQATSAIFPLA